MFRFILVACLIAGFVVPSQVSAEDIGKVKIGGGIGILFDDTTIGPFAQVGVAVYNFEQETLSALVEGTFEQYSETETESLGSIQAEATATIRIISANALMLYRYEKWYFLGGAGLAIGITNVEVSTSGLEVSESESKIRLNATAGAGVNINELLFTEARWSHQGGDLIVILGVKIN